ncbi:Endogenous retrovirus group K member 8 Pol protein, partial [Eudyptes schlegeli]
RGLKALELWQTDITFIKSFRNVQYVHVTIDTFSHMIWATAQKKANAVAARRHWLQCFAVMGVPQRIKTDNDAAYIAVSTQQFLKEWGITHITGIPGNSTGQAIIE